MSFEDADGDFMSVFRPARNNASQARQNRRRSEKAGRAYQGRGRPVQINFRTTPEFKAYAAKLASALGISASELYELAIEELGKARGHKGIGE